MKKIQVRNIPDEVYFALEQTAAKNERSIEGEVRYAIRNWITPEEPALSGSEQYQNAVSGRLNDLLRKTGEYQYDSLTPSQVAVELGVNDLGLVANWFSGHVIPSLSELEQLSKLFGCRAGWLIHGKGDVYEWRSGQRLEGAGRYAVKNLLAPDSEGHAVCDIRLFREDSDTGAILIIRQFSDTRRVDAFWTNIHLSEAIGATGESDLADFFVTLRALYKSFVKLDINVKGYMMPRAAYKTIREENQSYPMMLIKDYRVNESMWWEDVWDKGQRGHFKYWDGDDSLISRIEYVIKNKDYLQKELEEIRNSSELNPDIFS